MKFELRDYQIDVRQSVAEWIRKTIDPCCVSAPTGSGKALMAADISQEYLKLCRNTKKVLMLAPSAKLVKQNYATYLEYTGKPASVFSASANSKCLKHEVVIGTPQSIKNQVARLNGFGLVITDEAQEVSNSIINIIEHLKSKNPKLRVVGLTGTPFRLGQGYIYKHHYQKGAISLEECSESSYYHTCIYEIDTRMLIARGYLTKPVFDSNEIHYDTSKLIANRMGKFDDKAITETFEGKGRLTSEIVADVVEKTKYRNCVLWFASTIKHAYEIHESLPNSEVLTGSTKNMDAMLERFETGQTRHLINVGMLHRGYDAPFIDSIAILRATESATLYLQIIGRGLRLFEGKNECLILDYAENVERLAPHGDIFDPEIKSKNAKQGTEILTVECPMCNGKNEVKARPNPDEYPISKDGYFTDLRGVVLTTDDDKKIPIPAHYARRCTNELLVAGLHRQCEYRWSSKDCDACGHHNDISARFCEKCQEELVDPNEKLVLEAARIASDPYSTKLAKVQGHLIRQWPGKNGKPDTLRIDYIIDEKPHTVSEWYSPQSTNSFLFNRWQSFKNKAFSVDLNSVEDVINNKDSFIQPSEIAYRKKKGSQFYEVLTREWNT